MRIFEMVIIIEFVMFRDCGTLAVRDYFTALTAIFLDNEDE